MASHISLIEDGRAIGIDGQPREPRPLNPWLGFPLEVHPHMRQREVAHRSNPNPLLLLRTGASGRARIRSGQHLYELQLEPGQIDVFADGFQMDHGWWDCSRGEVVALELRAELLRDLLHEELPRLRLRTVLAGKDPVLEQLLTAIRWEIASGCHSGRLYAEGLSLAVLGCLRERYADPEAQGTPRQHRLTDAQVRTVADYVDARLTAKLGLEQLAGLLDMSPYHFARLFKSTVGQTPHRFVLARRIDAARHLLRQDRPLVDIAYAVGFSSQAHFTEAFRKHTGCTPARARAA